MSPATRGDFAVQDYHFRAGLVFASGLAPNSLYVAASFNHLGIVAQAEKGNLWSAAEYHSRSLAIRERLAPDSLDVPISLNNLGIVASDQGDFQAAQDFIVRCLTIASG